MLSSLSFVLAVPNCAKSKDVMAVREIDAAAAVVAVEVSGIAGRVQPCPGGRAHPLVCCLGGPGVNPTCFESTSSPFQQCPDGAFSFPDGRSCCPLDGSSACAATVLAVGTTTDGSPSDASTIDAVVNDADAGAANVATCSLPCPPGAYGNSAIEFETAMPTCTSSELSLPGADCLYCCFDNAANGGASCMSNACSCSVDHPCSCIPSCPSCPDGWQPPSAGQFDLCCQQSLNGTTSCFSQSTLVWMPR